MLSEFLANADQAHKERRHAEEVYWLDRAWPTLTQDLANLPVSRAGVRTTYALALYDSGNSEAAVVQSEIAWNELVSLQRSESGYFPPGYAEELLRALFVMATARVELGDARGAEQVFLRGINTAREHDISYSNALVAQTHEELAKLQARSGRLAEARATIEPVAAPTSAARCTPAWWSLLQLLADVQEDLKDKEGRAATMSRQAEDIVYGGCPRSD